MLVVDAEALETPEASAAVLAHSETAHRQMTESIIRVADSA